MPTPLQANPDIPFHREFEAAWNKLREGRPWIPEMRIEPDARERLEAMQAELSRLAALPGDGPIHCSRLHFAEWAETIAMALDAIRVAKSADDIL